MKVIIAPDSFKGSMTAFEAAKAIEKGVKRAVPNAETVLFPVGDGGEGTMDSLLATTNGRKVKSFVKNPLGKEIETVYGVLGDEKTAVIEMARASGISLIPNESLNPMKTTSYGTGELIKHALNDGYRLSALSFSHWRKCYQ